MRPIPIPDECVTEGMKRVVIAAPDGDLCNPDVAAVEAVAWLAELADRAAPCITMLVAFDEEDLERLQTMQRPALWLSMYTAQIPPFAVEVADGKG